jgi:glyoxylase-like metal-dependent hydrolase (beta-lactamase superfamily II)
MMHDNRLSGSSGEFRFQIIPAGSISCNAVVLWNELTRDAVIVDPTDDARSVVDFSKRQGLCVRQILLTHAHFDHAADAERAMTEFACPASLHADDFSLYFDIPNHAPLFGLNVSKRTLALSQVQDNQTIEDLPDYPIEVMHVPGHSAGSVAFYVPRAQVAFVGDTLFKGGVGRTDLPGGSSSKLATSIQTRLYSLPEGTLVIPGHGPTTTIGQEKSGNPFVRAARVEPTI